MSKIDWSDTEQVRTYHREYRRNNADRINTKRREERRNQPAKPGGKGKRGRKPLGNFEDVAYSIENFQDEISWDINLDKYLEGNVNE